jgi:hypothetical protein
MRERGVRLWRVPPKTKGDWIDEEGRTYDAVGPLPREFFDQQWKNFTKQIPRHLRKADLVPVDVSTLSAGQIQRVRAFIAPLGSRIFIVGEQWQE